MGFEPCCCFCGSKIGSLVIGFLQIFVSIVAIATLSYELHNIKKSDEEDVKPIEILGLVVNCLSLLLGVALVVGVRRNKPNFIKRWIFSRTVHLVVAIISFIVSMAKASEKVPAQVWTVDVVQIILPVWYLVTVRHYYKRLLSEQNPEGNVQQVYSISVQN